MGFLDSLGSMFSDYLESSVADAEARLKRYQNAYKRYYTMDKASLKREWQKAKNGQISDISQRCALKDALIDLGYVSGSYSKMYDYLYRDV